MHVTVKGWQGEWEVNGMASIGFSGYALRQGTHTAFVPRDFCTPVPEYRPARMPEDYGKEVEFANFGDCWKPGKLWGRLPAGLWVDDRGATWEACQIKETT